MNTRGNGWAASASGNQSRIASCRATDTPSAVISGASLGAFLSGRYAKRSMSTAIDHGHHHAAEQHGRQRDVPLVLPALRQHPAIDRQTTERADHEHLAVREVDQLDDAVHHRVAQARSGRSWRPARCPLAICCNRVPTSTSTGGGGGLGPPPPSRRSSLMDLLNPSVSRRTHRSGRRPTCHPTPGRRSAPCSCCRRSRRTPPCRSHPHPRSSAVLDTRSARIESDHSLSPMVLDSEAMIALAAS